MFRICEPALSGGSIQRMPILIPTGNFMPPANFVFAEFPAQIDDTIGKFIGKVAQSLIDVFDHYPQFMNRLQASADLMEGSNVERAHWASPTECGLRTRFTHFLLRTRN